MLTPEARSPPPAMHTHARRSRPKLNPYPGLSASQTGKEIQLPPTNRHKRTLHTQRYHQNQPSLPACLPPMTANNSPHCSTAGHATSTEYLSLLPYPFPSLPAINTPYHPIKATQPGSELRRNKHPPIPFPTPSFPSFKYDILYSMPTQLATFHESQLTAILPACRPGTRRLPFNPEALASRSLFPPSLSAGLSGLAADVSYC